MKVCTKCQRMLPAEAYSPHKRMRDGRQSQCRECMSLWRKAHPDYVREKNRRWRERYPNYGKDWTRKRQYGLEPKDVEALRQKQGFVCAGCERELLTVKECVDHDHKTGHVRGLLCDTCNRLVGAAKDSPTVLRRLAVYLEEAEAY